MKIAYATIMIIAIALAVAASGCLSCPPSGLGAEDASEPVTPGEAAITISGSSDQIKSIELPAGGYQFDYRYRGNLSVGLDDPATGKTISLIDTKARDGQEALSKTIYNVTDPAGSGTIINVTADAPYDITITALPANPVESTPPASVTLSGTNVVGPIRLHQGKATFAVKSSDFSMGTFSVVLKDGKTASQVGLIASSFSASGMMYTVSTGLNEKDTVDIPATGPYYLEVHVLPWNHPWTIEVTQ